MARMPGARFVGPSPNISKGGLLPSRVRGVVVHIAAGTFQGTIAWQKNPTADVSSHFIVSKKGEIVQMVDTSDAAWTQKNGNSEWLSIENEGYLPGPLTPEQFDANAKILLWASRTFPKVLLKVANSPAGYGLGHHSMGAENGADWGHSQCPGELIKNQKAGIVALAVLMQNGGGIVTDKDVALTRPQDEALSVAWQISDALRDGDQILPGTGGKDQPAAKRVWVVDTLIEIREGIRSLLIRTTPEPLRPVLTPTDHAEIGKATARALLDLMSGPAETALHYESGEAPEPEPRADGQLGWFTPQSSEQ